MKLENIVMGTDKQREKFNGFLTVGKGSIKYTRRLFRLDGYSG